MTSFDKYTPEYGYIPELYIFFYRVNSVEKKKKKYIESKKIERHNYSKKMDARN